MSKVISAAGSFVKEDLYKLLKSALYAGLGAAVVFIAQQLGLMDFGEYQVFASGIASFLIYLSKVFATKAEY